MSKLLFDSSFLISFLLEFDDNHNRAIILEQEKNIFQNELYISNHVIDEMITIIGQKISPQEAIKTYGFLKDNFTCINEYEINRFNDNVMLLYSELNTKTKQKIGFTDCSLIELGKMFNLDAIVTFDKGFENNGEINIIS